jgi:hypothetical protein
MQGQVIWQYLSISRKMAKSSSWFKIIVQPKKSDMCWSGGIWQDLAKSGSEMRIFYFCPIRSFIRSKGIEAELTELQKGCSVIVLLCILVCILLYTWMASLPLMYVTTHNLVRWYLGPMDLENASNEINNNVLFTRIFFSFPVASD